jgi:hypothetical protein
MCCWIFFSSVHKLSNYTQRLARIITKTKQNPTGGKNPYFPDLFCLSFQKVKMTFVLCRPGRGHHKICFLHSVLELINSIKILKIGLGQAGFLVVHAGCLYLSSEQPRANSPHSGDAGAFGGVHLPPEI